MIVIREQATSAKTGEIFLRYSVDLAIFSSVMIATFSSRFPTGKSLQTCLKGKGLSELIKIYFRSDLDTIDRQYGVSCVQWIKEGCTSSDDGKAEV